MKTIVSEKGQITIPKAIRDRLGIRPGQVLEFDTDSQGRLIGTKARVSRDALDELYGSLKLDRSTDEIMHELRGPVDTVDPE
jgi:AbrB family looped-hinge helix DNA binding protein